MSDIDSHFSVFVLSQVDPAKDIVFAVGTTNTPLSNIITIGIFNELVANVTTLAGNLQRERTDRLASEATLQQQISNLTAQLAAERAARLLAESGLSALITGEQNARLGNDSAIIASASLEAMYRTGNDSQLQTNINTVDTTRANNFMALNQALGQELSWRVGNETAIVMLVQAEETARRNDSSFLTMAINQETSWRVSNDTQLSGDLELEENTRMGNVSTLVSNLTAEVTARVSNVSTLTTSVTSLQDNSYLTTVVAGLQRDFQTPTPKAGWSYNYNSQPIGAGVYGNLVYNSAQGGYACSSSAYPGSGICGWAIFRNTSAHPGRDVTQYTNGTFDGYGLATFTISTAGYYYIDGWVTFTNTGSCSDGGQLIVIKGPGVVYNQRVNYALNVRNAFQVVLGDLTTGTAIRVGVGPAGADSCDNCAMDFSLRRVTTAWRADDVAQNVTTIVP